MILAPIVRGRKGEFRKLFEQLAAEGFVRVRVDKQLRQLDEEIKLDRRKNHTIEVVVDRLLLSRGSRPAWRLPLKPPEIRQRNRGSGGGEWRGAPLPPEWACVGCGMSIPALEPRSFSFNSVYGACPSCRGLGSQYTFDPAKVIADWSRPLLKGGLPARAPAALNAAARAAEQIGFDLKPSF